MKQIIEILPGIRIEVNRKLRAKAGPPSWQAKTLNSPEQAMASVRRAQRKNVIYSRILLDEAVKIAEKEGVRRAAEITGVGAESINQHQDELRGPNPQAQGIRYSLAQKQACVALALKLMAMPATKRHTRRFGTRLLEYDRPLWAQRPAFVEAGKRLGVNGRSCEFMWKRGMIPPSTPQPPAPPA